MNYLELSNSYREKVKCEVLSLEGKYFGLEGGWDGELLFNGNGVLNWKNENILWMDSGDSCIAL